MRLMKIPRERSSAALLCAAGLCLTAGASFGAGAPPSPSVDIEQEALGTALPRLGALYGVNLRAGASLREQRVTLLGRGVPLATWKSALTSLLSPDPKAAVFWSRQAGGAAYYLEASHRRTELARRLAQQERDSETQQLLARIEEARKRASLLRDGDGRSGPNRPALLSQVGGLLLLDSKGSEGVRKLRGGEPMVLSARDIARAPFGELVLEWLSERGKKPDGYIPPEGGALTVTSSYFGASAVARNRFEVAIHDEHGWVKGRGSLGGGSTLPVSLQSGELALGSALHSAHSGGKAASPLNLATPLSREDPKLPTATLNLAPARARPKGTSPYEFVTPVQLHSLLRRIHQATGAVIVADGYLRPPLYLPDNVRANQAPVERLIARLAEKWDAETRTIGTGADSPILVRARRWWGEDEANVPAETVAALASKLDGKAPPELDDLARLAELREAQIYRLTVESNLLPGAAEVIHMYNTTGDGAHYFLRSFAALPAQLRAQALSEPGAPLDLAPLALAQVRPGLIRFGGGHRPDLLKGLNLFMERRTTRLKDGRWAWRYTYWVRGTDPSRVFYGYPMGGASPEPEEAPPETDEVTGEGAAPDSPPGNQ